MAEIKIAIPHNTLTDYGYTPITTFWEDFSIAEQFGKAAIEDTFKRAMAEWKTNYIYLTELVMVLNHKLWAWYQGAYGMDRYSMTYQKLWEQADGYAVNELHGDELRYFYQTTD